MNNDYPIGIFDSGIGGLTVAKAIRSVLPNESLLYFGDTKHLPYGEKSAHAIQEFSKNIAIFLKQKNWLIHYQTIRSFSQAKEL